MRGGSPGESEEEEGARESQPQVRTQRQQLLQLGVGGGES